ncbi:hypothetical protein F441_06077 [Phytophthora nicotianae CJ01A1]|uniref:Uncharacterized protein n=1 Tax=Phytophthora nicotianae CJ01A1 TaxID=1317063 RepID=W2XBB0_PHYNI|nr:hypothetical protein F441_06077 [Phytophthora nicotianae CJ01A1]
MPDKSTPRRKRGAPVSSGPKKKQSVAAKKKHVRELARAGKWTEIEKMYGKRLLVKAKAYAEKNRMGKTPQETAREILMKNGLLSSASQANTTPTALENQQEESGTRVNVPRVNTSLRPSSPNPLTKEQQELIEKRRQEALERRRLPTSPPGTLTKEQQERIEKRRREALEKRRRVQNFGMNRVQPPAVIQPDPAHTSRYGLLPSVAPLRHQQPPQVSRIEASRPTSNTTHRVVTPDNLPTTTTNQAVEIEPARPDYFWNDFEAAAEIVQWEHEHMAEAALVQPPAKTPRDFNRQVDALQHSQHIQYEKPRTRTPPGSGIPSISQELAAAAEIIQWEKEHEIVPDVPAPCRLGENSDNDPEFDAPQFQLLPVQVIDDVDHERNAIKPVHLQRGSAQPGLKLPNNDPQLKSRSHRKRPLVTSPPPALPHNSAVSSTAAKCPGGKNKSHSTSPRSSENQRDRTAEFLDKHLLENKLELPVLEFLDMMLA